MGLLAHRAPSRTNPRHVPSPRNPLNLLLLPLLLAAIPPTRAVNTVYVTDLPAYSVLAPCAQSGISYAVMSLTYAACPESVTALASCACSKDNNAVAIPSSISVDVLSACGSTATDDVSSAQVVFGYYCAQDSAPTTAAADQNTVQQYITDISAFSDMAPCAQSALSYAVMALTDDVCPSGGPGQLASCACTKQQNSLVVSEAINSLVNEDCGKTNTQDITSAQAVFAGYCLLGNGTTAFPTLSNLPGSVNYYITDMPIYSSLAPCATDAVSYAIFSMTYDYCPSNPEQLASCACVKDQNTLIVTSNLQYYISEDCGKTASDDFSSALFVYQAYCSAALGLATPTGSIATETTTPYSTHRLTTTGRSGVTAPVASSTTSSSSSASGTSPTSSNDTNSNPGGSSHLGVIIGVAAAAVFVIAAFLWGVWVYRKRRRNAAFIPPAAPPPYNPGMHDPNYQAELQGNALNMQQAYGAGAITRKPAPTVKANTVSPMPSPAPGHAEVYGDDHHNLSTSTTPVPPSVAPPGSSYHEMLAYQQTHHEMLAQQQQPFLSPSAQELSPGGVAMGGSQPDRPYDARYNNHEYYEMHAGSVYNGRASPRGS